MEYGLQICCKQYLSGSTTTFFWFQNEFLKTRESETGGHYPQKRQTWTTDYRLKFEFLEYCLQICSKQYLSGSTTTFFWFQNEFSTKRESKTGGNYPQKRQTWTTDIRLKLEFLE